MTTVRQEDPKRFVLQCSNGECAATLAIEGTRARTVMCPLCHATTLPIAVLLLGEGTPRLDVGNGVALIGGRVSQTPRAPATTHNLPHSQWLTIVDRITRRWLLAEIAYAGSSVVVKLVDMSVATGLAFDTINTERQTHGLPALTWEDVADEAAKF